jgi:hypothetical protein
MTSTGISDRFAVSTFLNPGTQATSVTSPFLEAWDDWADERFDR